MSDGMRREFTYLSSHATNRYFIPNWGIYMVLLFNIYGIAVSVILYRKVILMYV